MEFKDLITVLKRRLVLLLVVFALLMGAGAFETVRKTRTRYQAAARVLVIFERVPVSNTDADFLRYQVPGGISLPTRQLILGSPQMFPLTAAVYLAFADRQKPKGF